MSQTLSEVTNQVFSGAIQLAAAWQLAGRWDDALTFLAGLEPLARELGNQALATRALMVARVLTDQAMFGGADTQRDRETWLQTAYSYADQVADPALSGAIWDASGTSLHTAFLSTDRQHEPPDELTHFQRGLACRQQAGDGRGCAESLFHVGLVYGVVRQDHQQARPYFEEAYRLAQAAGDQVIASYAIRHIGFAQYDQHDLAAARASLAESLRLREAAGFVPGV